MINKYHKQRQSLLLMLLIDNNVLFYLPLCLFCSCLLIVKCSRQNIYIWSVSILMFWLIDDVIK
jgi:hypothetical protein